METQKRYIYLIGGIFAIITLIGIVIDIVAGNILGGSLDALPQTASERFLQFQQNKLIGLYNLDLLNIINQIFMIPVYYALYVSHRDTVPLYALLALIVFLAGSIIFITTNTALPMLELSNKYAHEKNELQKSFLLAAGEAMLARGAHASLGVFIGFLLPNIAGIIMSLVMLIGKVFNKTISVLGIAGNTLLLFYIISVTFFPGAKSIAVICAMPGGLCVLTWMILFTSKLFRIAK